MVTALDATHRGVAARTVRVAFPMRLESGRDHAARIARLFALFDERQTAAGVAGWHWAQEASIDGRAIMCTCWVWGDAAAMQRFAVATDGLGTETDPLGWTELVSVTDTPTTPTGPFLLALRDAAFSPQE